MAVPPYRGLKQSPVLWAGFFTFILYLHLRPLKNLNLSQSTQRDREELNKKLTLRPCERFLFNAGIAFPIEFAACHTDQLIRKPLSALADPTDLFG